MRLALSAAALSTALLAAGPARAAEPWGIPGEKPMVLKGRVVDAICHLTGQCPRDCGAGRRGAGTGAAGGAELVVAAAGGAGAASSATSAAWTRTSPSAGPCSSE